MTETSHRPPTPMSRRVAFVELADHAVNVLARYEEALSWEVALVVARDPDCKAAAVAEASRIPVHDSPDYSSLVACDRVVVGNVPAYIPAFVREMLQGTAAEVVEADEALRRLEEEARRESGARTVAWDTDKAPDSPSGDACTRAFPDEGGTCDEDFTGWEELARHDELPGGSAAGGGVRGGNEAAPAKATEPRVTAGQPTAGHFTTTVRGATADPSESSDQAVTRHSSTQGFPSQGRPDTVKIRAAATRVERQPRAARPHTIASSSRLFDPETLLGLHIGKETGGIAVNTRDPRLIDTLMSAVRIEHAGTASLMLLDADGEHLRIAAACGMSEQQVSSLRIRRGEGLAGKAFASREAQATAGWIPGMAEDASRPVYRLSASIPVIVSGRPIGILSINAEAPEMIFDRSILAPLARIADGIPAAILAAVDLSGLEGSARRSALQLQADRFLSLELPVAERLRHVTEALRAATGADYAHLFLHDALSRRLEPLTLAIGLSALTAGPIPIDRGFFGWIMRHGRPLLLEACDEPSGERVGILSYPLQASRSQSLLVLENIPLDQISRDELLRMAEEVLGQVEETIGVEVNVGVHELISELNMRIADQVGHLAELPAPERIPALVEFTVNLVAAEAAAWIPSPGRNPIMSRTLTPQARLIASWGDFEALAQWTREKGREAEGAVARWWDSGAPAGPSPYVGVPAPGGEGVLLIFFSPEEDAGAHNQVPPHVLWHVLDRLTELIAREEDAARIQEMHGMQVSEPPAPRTAEPEAPEAGPPPEDQILEAEMLARLIHREQRRSERYGHSLCLTRFKLTGETESTSVGTRNALGNFLLRLKGERDLVSEIKPRFFVMLSPENRSDALANPHILAERWRAEQPRTRLEIEQRICPQDGAADVILENWLLPDRAAGRAA